jgi:hypothetical protein
MHRTAVLVVVGVVAALTLAIWVVERRDHRSGCERFMAVSDLGLPDTGDAPTPEAAVEHLLSQSFISDEIPRTTYHPSVSQDGVREMVSDDGQARLAVDQGPNGWVVTGATVCLG